MGLKTRILIKKKKQKKKKKKREKKKRKKIFLKKIPVSFSNKLKLTQNFGNKNYAKHSKARFFNK